MYPDTYTLYYYNGTAFPVIRLEEEDAFKYAKQYLKNVGGKVSIQEQTKEYYAQLKNIEQLLIKYCNPSSEEGLKKVSKEYGKSIDDMYALWALNVCCLLLMGKMQDDRNNGIFTVKTNNHTRLLIDHSIQLEMERHELKHCSPLVKHQPN